MWTYIQSDGRLLDRRGEVVAQGYAGLGVGKNNPEMQTVHNVGPLPCGIYGIEAPVDTTLHGPYVLWFIPDPENEMFGRSKFGIHGDSLVHPGSASDGCIIMPPNVRHQIWDSGDHLIRVISSLPDNFEAVEEAATGEN